MSVYVCVRVLRVCARVCALTHTYEFCVRLRLIILLVEGCTQLCTFVFMGVGRCNSEFKLCCACLLCVRVLRVCARVCALTHTYEFCTCVCAQCARVCALSARMCERAVRACVCAQCARVCARVPVCVCVSEWCLFSKL
jgi:hypothetical protein